MDRLERVAREIARKQMIVLEGVGKKFDRTIDLSEDPDGTSLEPAILTLDSVRDHVSIDVLDVDRDNREIEVELTHRDAGSRAGTADQDRRASPSATSTFR